MQETIRIKQYAAPETPASVEAYLAKGGYQAAAAVLKDAAPVVECLSASGLRGRSGSSFPVGLKWTTTVNAADPVKYIVCNADEGEPGTAKDRWILANEPHCVLEGMLIAARTAGAQKGFIYLRKEYEELLPILRQAIEEAARAGYLGENIQGSGFDFDIELRLGAGAYICGEETALLESIEGRRGETRLKPPFPGEKGLWQHPTIINNVESLAQIAGILRMGAEEFRAYGTEKCPGTKLMTLSGHIRRPGVYEIPIGTTVREIFERFGGGCPDGKRLMAIQTGGQSGTIVTPDFLDVPFDIESCNANGGFFGTGNLMFIAEGTDLIDLVLNMTQFFVEESCGKCVPCRIGLVRMTELLTRLRDGLATEEDVNELEETANHVKLTARCALGAAAVTPVLSSLKNFAEVYRAAANKGGVNYVCSYVVC